MKMVLSMLLGALFATSCNQTPPNSQTKNILVIDREARESFNEKFYHLGFYDNLLGHQPVISTSTLSETLSAGVLQDYDRNIIKNSTGSIYALAPKTTEQFQDRVIRQNSEAMVKFAIGEFSDLRVSTNQWGACRFTSSAPVFLAETATQIGIATADGTLEPKKGGKVENCSLDLIQFDGRKLMSEDFYFMSGVNV